MFIDKDILRFKGLQSGERGLLIRQEWSKRVDRNFIESFRTVHWGSIDDIQRIVYKTRPPREISCAAYEDTPFKCDFLGGVGLEIKGNVVLAGNGDLGTQLVNFNGLDVKITEAYDRLIFDESSCSSPYEFVVSDYKPCSLTLDLEMLYAENDPNTVVSVVEETKRMASEFNIPCYITT